MITIELDDKKIQSALDDVGEVLDDMTTVMQEIAEMLHASVQDRIAAGVSPDGSALAPKSETTMNLYRRKREGVDSRPLIHTGQLLRYGLHSNATSESALIASNEPYAAAMQFGAAKGSFGAYSVISKKNQLRYAGTSPWGNIPARPFMGFSDEDRDNIKDIVMEAIAGALR